MLDHYSTLLAKGAIEQWTHDYPDFVSAHADQQQGGCNTAMVTHSLVTYPRALAYVRRMST
jgi:hypothetical protein